MLPDNVCIYQPVFPFARWPIPDNGQMNIMDNIQKKLDYNFKSISFTEIIFIALTYPTGSSSMCNLNIDVLFSALQHYILLLAFSHYFNTNLICLFYHKLQKWNLCPRCLRKKHTEYYIA